MAFYGAVAPGTRGRVGLTHSANDVAAVRARRVTTAELARTRSKTLGTLRLADTSAGRHHTPPGAGSTEGAGGMLAGRCADGRAAEFSRARAGHPLMQQEQALDRQPSARTVGRALSLERRLQLVMAAVLACILASLLVLTYGELNSSATDTLRARLQRASGILARTIEDAIAPRNAALRALASDSLVVEALAATERIASRPEPAPRSLARALAEGALEKLERHLDSDPRRFPLELWSERGERIAVAGREQDPVPDVSGEFVHPVRRPGLGAPQPDDSTHVGDLVVRDGRAYYWTASPVVTNGRRLGFVAQRVRIGGPSGPDQTLRDLTGEDVTMRMRTAAGLWVARTGVAIDPPLRRDSTARGVTLVRASNQRTLVGEAPVRGTPWLVVLESSEGAVQARTMRTVGSLAVFSLLLVLIGATASLIMGKRVTRPLASLTTAAEAIAAGDYTRRVSVGGRDEIGRLATSFNQMATEVDSSRRELERRVREAQWTAEELEDANRQLLDSMVEAEQTRRDAEGARAEAERANQAKSDFLAVMSHELRTPLNAIGGYAQLLELEIHGPITPAQRDALERIGRSQAHLLRLINDVLYFARIDAARVNYAMADIPLEETLRAIEPLIAPQVSAKRLRFDYRACAGELTVRADRDRLQQIILNLLSNAIKYTPEGGQVTVDCEIGEREILIRVADTGIGIPPDRLASVFDPFVQVDRGRTRPNDGVGLGLAISRDLALGMGGELSAESTVGRGSVFTVRLTRGVDVGAHGAAVAGSLEGGAEG